MVTARLLRTRESEGTALRAGARDEVHPCWGSATSEAWKLGSGKAGWRGPQGPKLRRVVSQGPRMPFEPRNIHTLAQLLCPGSNWAAALQWWRGGEEGSLRQQSLKPKRQCRPMENKDCTHSWGSCMVIHGARAPPLRRGQRLCIFRVPLNVDHEAWGGRVSHVGNGSQVLPGSFSMYAFLEKHLQMTQKKRTWRWMALRICCGNLFVLNEYSGLYLTGISHFFQFFFLKRATHVTEASFMKPGSTLPRG